MDTLSEEIAKPCMRECEPTKCKLCIQEELEQQRNNNSGANLHYKDATDTVDSCELNNPDSLLSDKGAPSSNYSQTSANWRQGCFGCIKPVLTHIMKTSFNAIKFPKQDDTETYNLREIPHEAISELEWLAYGASAAVYTGIFEEEVVVVKHVFKRMRFNMEMDLKHIRKLNHKNIVKFKGVCTTSCCTIMEHCKYGSLYDCLKQIKLITPPRLLEWATQIATGMQYLHAHKIIHRDLKSPNILINDEGVLKISDFGVSTEWNNTNEDVTKYRSLTGTPAWMAPEMLLQKPYNEKIDVWSYGVVVWELLTCKIPYEGAGGHQIMFSVAGKHLRLSIPPTCPNGFNNLINLCWSDDPEERPSFARILLYLKNTVEFLSQPTDNYIKRHKKEIQLHMQEMQCKMYNQYKKIINPLCKIRDRYKRRKASDTQSTSTTPEIDTISTDALHDLVDIEL